MPENQEKKTLENRVDREIKVKKAMGNFLDACTTVALGLSVINLFTGGYMLRDIFGIDREIAPVYTFIGILAAGGSYVAKALFFSDEYSPGGGDDYFDKR